MIVRPLWMEGMVASLVTPRLYLGSGGRPRNRISRESCPSYPFHLIVPSIKEIKTPCSISKCGKRKLKNRTHRRVNPSYCVLCSTRSSTISRHDDRVARTLSVGMMTTYLQFFPLRYGFGGRVRRDTVIAVTHWSCHDGSIDCWFDFLWGQSVTRLQKQNNLFCRQQHSKTS
jgi:hypothetical protein